MPTHVITANGISADPNTGDVQIPIFKRKTIITNNQIIALPTTEIEIVPAQGAGKVTLPLLAFMKISTVAPYGNLGGTLGGQTQFTIGGADIVKLAVPQTGDVDNALNQASASTKYLKLIQQFDSYTAASYDVVGGYARAGQPIGALANNINSIINSALTIYLQNYDSEGTYLDTLSGGDPSNTLEVTVLYSIVDL
jgi:hypothetical protein